MRWDTLPSDRLCSLPDRAAQALEPLEYGLRLNPYDPQNFHWWRILALARLLCGESDRALEATLRALDLRPSWRLSLETAVLCYAALEQWKEAAECIAELRLSAPVKSDPVAILGLRHPQWDELKRDARTACRVRGRNWHVNPAAQVRRNHVEDALRRARLRRAAKPGAARSGLKS